MKPNRRDFLKILLASAMAEAIDFEKLLWVPKQIITVPAIRGGSITYDVILKAMMQMKIDAPGACGYITDIQIPD